MALVEFAFAQSSSIRGYKAFASDVAGNLAHLAVSALSAPSAGLEPAKDQDFSARRMKVSKLPAIEACQGSIFGQLRAREDEVARTKNVAVINPTRRSLFGMKARMAMMFAPSSMLIN